MLVVLADRHRSFLKGGLIAELSDPFTEQETDQVAESLVPPWDQPHA